MAIKVTPVKNSKGVRLQIKNHNGHIFNHYYNRASDARRAWNRFVKQVKEGKVTFEDVVKKNR